MKEPWQKRHKKEAIEMRKHIYIIERKKSGKIKKKKKYQKLEYKYRIKKEGINIALEELKQILQAKAQKK